jgi:hypothetical protein
MQQLATSHTENLAALTAKYETKQLDERKDAEAVSSVLSFDRMLPATAEAN